MYSGANTIPCGTPERTEEGLLLTPLITTDWNCPCKKNWSNFQTLSKAFEKSENKASICSPEFNALVKSFTAPNYIIAEFYMTVYSGNYVVCHTTHYV